MRLPYKTLLFVFVLASDIWKYAESSCDVSVRYERDAAFEGIVPTPALYYISHNPILAFASCTLFSKRFSMHWISV